MAETKLEVEKPPVEEDERVAEIEISTNVEDIGDQALRAFILEHYGSGAYDIDGRIFVENMESVFQWIRTGKVLPRDKKKS